MAKAGLLIGIRRWWQAMPAVAVLAKCRNQYSTKMSSSQTVEHNQTNGWRATRNGKHQQ